MRLDLTFQNGITAGIESRWNWPARDPRLGWSRGGRSGYPLKSGVLTGGRRREDVGELFYEPTILTGVTPEMECYAEETFGPVVSIYPVLDDDEAVARANESDYGLNASVWTSDHERGRRVASKIKCGAVNVNEGFAATFGSIDAPMGGMKNSGLGRRQGRDGIRRFVDVQSVATQTGIPLAPSRGLDGKSFTSLMTGALRIMKKAGRA